MAYQQKIGFCKVCDQKKLIARDGPNHLVHFIMTLLTGGFWVIFWLLAVMTSGHWYCSSCGNSN
jgi:hypothetical protein